MTAPTWKTLKQPEGRGCTYADRARWRGFFMRVSGLKSGETRAVVERRPSPGEGWFDIAEFTWPNREGKAEVTRRFAREWCERTALKHQKSKGRSTQAPASTRRG